MSNPKKNQTTDMMIAPDQMHMVESFLERLSSPTAENVLAGARAASAAAKAEAGFWDEFTNTGYEWLRPYAVANGVLVVPVMGVLLPDFPYQYGAWATGYEYITEAVKRGVEDPKVNAIVLKVNSPGGWVAGCFDCADAIFGARGAKPIVSVAAETALSAAYAIASAADSITVARTGAVGSVGVMTSHTDITGYLENVGLKVTLVYAGAQKADGYPEKPLDDAAKGRIQSRVDALYDIFVTTVSRNRGIDAAVVRATEAGVFMASDAIEKGLADKVGNLDTETSAYADPLPEPGEDDMTTTPTPTAAAPAAAATDNSEAVRSAERSRMAAIIGSEEGKAQPALANHLAFNTTMSADEAVAALKAAKVDAPAAAAPAPAPAAEAPSAFVAAMNGEPGPQLGAAPAPAAATGSKANAIFASAGYGPVKA